MIVTIHRSEGDVTGEGSHISKMSIQTPHTFLKHNYEKKMTCFQDWWKERENFDTFGDQRKQGRVG